MLGAIIGDLAGSIYEYSEYKEVNLARRLSVLNKDNLIDDDSFYTDDTIMTIAILNSVLNGTSYQKNLRSYGLRFYDKVPETKAQHFTYMFSPNFIKWCQRKGTSDSTSNEALIRVSPIAYLNEDLNKILKETKKATIPTHNTDIAIKGAQKVNSIIYYGRLGLSKKSLKMIYLTDKTSLSYLQRYNTFDSTCKVLDKCINVLLQSSSFEDAVRKAISIGGDTDTIGAITGSMAEALYGIPEELKVKAYDKLPKEFIDELDKGYKKVKCLKKL